MPLKVKFIMTRGELQMLTKYSIVVLCILILTLATASLVICLIHGEFVLSLCFLAILGLGCRELHLETNRLQDYY